MQEEEEEGEKVPAGHWEQDVEPKDDAWVPAVQSEHHDNPWEGA